jgi:RimJ/RimL family protein N-acetyltransferase
VTPHAALDPSAFLAFAQALNAPVVTSRLVLEPLTSAHADVFFVPLQDDRIYRWISASAPSELQHLRETWHWGEGRVSPSGDEAWLGWAARRKSCGSYVGKLDAQVNAARVVTNLGYIFLPDFWNQGFASECARAIAEHFARHGLLEVHAFVTLGNEASERALLRAGFTRRQVIANNDVIRGVAHDDVQYVFQSSA